MILSLVLAGGCLAPPDDPGGILRLPQEFRLDDDLSLTLGLWGRVTLIDGTVVDNFPFDDDVTYADIFDPGLGFRLEAGLLWTLAPGWQAGPLLSLGFDRYRGVRDVDAFGDSVEPEDLESVSALVGFRGVMSDPSGFWGEMHVSGGILRWSDVDATFTISGTTTSGVSFFDGVSRGAFELGGKIGLQSGPLVVGIGTGLVVEGGPARGSDVTASVDPTAVLGFYLELGVELSF